MTPDGKVFYCNRGVIKWAEFDQESPKLLMRIGLTASEMSGVKFYRVPTSMQNAYANVTNLDIAVVVVFDGLLNLARSKSLDSNSVLAGVLAHELGHIIDMRKKGFTNIRASKQRVYYEACDNRLKNTQRGSAAWEERYLSCRRALGADSRSAEYSADNFAAELLARKKYPADIKPSETIKFFKLIGTGFYNPMASHPDGKERGIQFERTLQRLGVQVDTSPIITEQ